MSCTDSKGVPMSACNTSHDGGIDLQPGADVMRHDGYRHGHGHEHEHGHGEPELAFADSVYWSRKRTLQWSCVEEILTLNERNLKLVSCVQTSID